MYSQGCQPDNWPPPDRDRPANLHARAGRQPSQDLRTENEKKGKAIAVPGSVSRSVVTNFCDPMDYTPLSMGFPREEY